VHCGNAAGAMAKLSYGQCTSSWRKPASLARSLPRLIAAAEI